MKGIKYLIPPMLFALTIGCGAHSKPAIKNDSDLLGGSEHAAVTVDKISPGTNVKSLYYSGPQQGKQVALTFDDGPDNHFTLQILDILKKNNVKATFFIVGENAKAHPEVVKRIIREGHAIGNHSWDHPDFPKISTEKITEEIRKTQDELNSIVGFRPAMFRPPYGAVNSSDNAIITSMGLNIIDWSVDTKDWAGASPQQILNEVKKELQPGGIILQHCAGGKKGNLSNTVAALEQMIPLLKKEGYTFVTVPKLLSLPEFQN